MLAIFPEIQKWIKEKNIDHLALLVRKYYCQPKPFAPHVDVKKLFAQVGIPVSFVEIPEQAALVVKDENGAFAVHALIHPAVSEGPDANFMYAHLLGHFLLHVQPQIVSGDWHKGGFKEMQSPLDNFFSKPTSRKKNDLALQREHEANAFAAALLVPAVMLTKAQEKIPTLDRMAQFFGVSETFLERRIEDVGAKAQTTLPEIKIQSRSRKSEPKKVQGPQNFMDAEEILEQQNQPLPSPKANPMFSDTQTPKPQMPRSFAASTYGKTEKQTQKPATDKGKNPAPSSEPKASPTPEKVMARLRSLANKIDSSVNNK